MINPIARFTNRKARAAAMHGMMQGAVISRQQIKKQSFTTKMGKLTTNQLSQEENQQIRIQPRLMQKRKLIF